MKRIKKEEAIKLGFTIDNMCYPHLGYTGPRFSPKTQCHVFTDIEAELLEVLILIKSRFISLDTDVYKKLEQAIKNAKS